jgi:hypothetical protein
MALYHIGYVNISKVLVFLNINGVISGCLLSSC